MTTATLEHTHVAVRTAVGQALDAHRRFADVVAGLDLDDRVVWAAADRSAARISVEANDVVAALTGERWAVAPPGVPPVVRVRELSVALRRMEAALTLRAGSGRVEELAAVLTGMASRVTESARWLGIVTAGVMPEPNMGRHPAGR